MKIMLEDQALLRVAAKMRAYIAAKIIGEHCVVEKCITRLEKIGPKVTWEMHILIRDYFRHTKRPLLVTFSIWRETDRNPEIRLYHAESKLFWGNGYIDEKSFSIDRDLIGTKPLMKLFRKDVWEFVGDRIFRSTMGRPVWDNFGDWLWGHTTMKTMWNVIAKFYLFGI